MQVRTTADDRARGDETGGAAAAGPGSRGRRSGGGSRGRRSGGGSRGRRPGGGSRGHGTPEGGRVWQRFRRDWLLLLIGLPGLAALLLFQYLPLLGNVIAFQDYQAYLGIQSSEWIGFSNFSIIFNGDPEFVNALVNTLVISFIQVVFVFPVPIALALLLNSVMFEPAKRIVQSIVYLPHFLSWVIVVALFQEMLGNAGMLNTFLGDNNLPTVDIIGNPDWFKGLVTSQIIWKETGWNCIIFLAAISRVDTQLYESAAVDGASGWRRIWHITLPSLRSLIILLLILRLGHVLTVGFEQIVLQQSAVGIPASEVLDTYVYNHGIVDQQWGVSAAVGLVKGLFGFALIVAANKVAHAFGERGVYSR